MPAERFLLTDLDRFPECRDVVGRVVLTYAELESLLFGMIANCLNIDANDAGRLLYRTRSESQRLALADAACRPFFQSHRLTTKYNQWLAAMRRCKAIRNQYAHAIWVVRKGNLTFGDFDAAAKSTEGPAIIPFYGVDLDLLNEQEEFFRYAGRCLIHLANEAYRLRDRRRRNRDIMPKPLAQPKLHNGKS